MAVQVIVCEGVRTVVRILQVKLVEEPVEHRGENDPALVMKASPLNSA